MPKDWTGDLVGLMHTHKITGIQLAKKLGLTDRYVSMVLNGHREPDGAEQRFREAVEQIISEQSQHTTENVR